MLCLFLPTFLSVAGTTVVYQWTINRENPIEEHERTEMGFLTFTKRETIGISFLVAASLAYFFSYFLFPLSLSVQMVDKWYFFVAWYLSLTLILTLVYTAFHHWMANYENVGCTEPFCFLKQTIESTCHLNVHLFIQKESEHETNAWVYSTPFVFKKGFNMYMTEGLVKKFTLEELKAVLFHEIGHVKRKHGRWILSPTFGITTLTSITLFFARKVMLGHGWWQYIVLLPVSVVILIWLTEWLPNKISKMFEHQADEYAVRQLGDKELYIQTLRKLQQISEIEDGEFVGKRKEWKKTHPSFEKRINVLKKLK